MIDYDKDVLTITEILQALDKFENKAEIVEAIKECLYTIQLDWHMEEWYRNELSKCKLKEVNILNILKGEQ